MHVLITFKDLQFKYLIMIPRICDMIKSKITTITIVKVIIENNVESSAHIVTVEAIY